jgi:DNA-binding MurR/RpiR family transcriptional regulator
MTFRERISHKYGDLPPSFRKLADFMLTSHQRVAFMSASRLARYLGLDVATVTRFSQYLGYEGYVELIHEIQDQVLEEMRATQATVAERIEAARGTPAEMRWRDYASLEMTTLGQNPDLMEAAVAEIKRARRIYVCAEGVGAGLAQLMVAYLSMCKPAVVLLDKGPFDASLELKELAADDVVVGIGFTNYAYQATRVVEYARHVGAKTIGIVAQGKCPIGATAEIVFISAEVEGNWLPSPTGVAAITFALVSGLYRQDMDRFEQELAHFQAAYRGLTQGTPRQEAGQVEELREGI